jgi:hypothetical protein
MGDLPPPPIPPRPDGAPSTPERPRRLRFVALALLVSQLAPGIIAVLALIPGSSSDPTYAFLDRRYDGKPFRWEPCAPIHYEVNLDYAPSDALADVDEAIARVSDASGIRFVFDGQTVRSPEEQEADDFRDPVTLDIRPVLIAWLPAASFDRYANPERTLGVGRPVTGSGNEFWVYESGLIVINADAPLVPGFEHSYSLGPVLMHELGHVMGLGHVGDADEIMWSPNAPGSDRFPAGEVTDWGNGDLVGLQQLGRPAGCIHAPGESTLPDEEITPSPRPA